MHSLTAKISSLFGSSQVGGAQNAGPGPTGEFAQKVLALDKDPYLAVADQNLKIISVFDDLKYDRADLDALSEPMRRRVLEKLTPLGFKQVSGLVFENEAEDIRMHVPKFRALGASPFDATADQGCRTQDYFVLTPTQAACQMIDQYPTDEAVSKIKTLIAKHPINILRISDFLERKPSHQAFIGAIGHLKYIQREAIEAEPLRSRRALR